MPSLVNEWFYLSSARFLLVKTVQYSSQRRGTPNLHLLSHPLTLRRCNLSNESNCIVCRDAPLEFLNLPWCPSPVTGIAVVPSLTQTFPRQELQCPMTNEIRPQYVGACILCLCMCMSVGVYMYVYTCMCVCMYTFLLHMCMYIYMNVYV